MTNEGEYREYYANMADSSTSDWGVLEPTTACTVDPKYWSWVQAPGHIVPNNKKGDDNMRYLYEVILVNPKNDEFVVDRFVAKTETSAIMQAYDEYSEALGRIAFDDLKTSCRVLFEWKKEYPKTAVE